MHITPSPAAGGWAVTFDSPISQKLHAEMQKCRGEQPGLATATRDTHLACSPLTVQLTAVTVLLTPVVIGPKPPSA